MERQRMACTLLGSCYSDIGRYFHLFIYARRCDVCVAWRPFILMTSSRHNNNYFLKSLLQEKRGFMQDLPSWWRRRLGGLRWLCPILPCRLPWCGLLWSALPTFLLLSSLKANVTIEMQTTLWDGHKLWSWHFWTCLVQTLLALATHAETQG